MFRSCFNILSERIRAEQNSQTPEQGNTSRADPSGPEGSRCVEDQKRCYSFPLRFSRGCSWFVSQRAVDPLPKTACQTQGEGPPPAPKAPTRRQRRNTPEEYFRIRKTGEKKQPNTRTRARAGHARDTRTRAKNKRPRLSFHRDHLFFKALSTIPIFCLACCMKEFKMFNRMNSC